MPVKLFWLWIGGGFGTIGRYLVSTSLHQWLGFTFPFGTFGVNFLGCLIIGVLGEAFAETVVHPDVRLFWITGVLGGFTTFSSFGLDTVTLVKNGELPTALVYILVSVLLGIGAVWVGMYLTKAAIAWGISP